LLCQLSYAGKALTWLGFSRFRGHRQRVFSSGVFQNGSRGVLLAQLLKLSVYRPRFSDGRNLSCMVFLLAEPFRQRVVEFAASPIARFPHWIEDRVNVPSRVLNLRCWDATKRAGPVFGLVVAPDKVPTRIASPERKVG
jgi:hypothetical protein